MEKNCNVLIISFVDFARLDDQMFINRNSSPPVVLRFNPYEPHIAVADRVGVK